MSNGWLVALATIPLFTRGLMWWWHTKAIQGDLSEAEKAQDTHRSVIIPLAGFSFSALVALAIANNTIDFDLILPVIFLLISFVCFYVAMNIQSYKSTRIGDNVGTAFYETATLCLFLAVADILFRGGDPSVLKYLGFLGVLAWLIDHAIRVVIMWKYLTALENPGGS